MGLSRTSVKDDGGVVAGVQNKVVVSHGILFSFCASVGLKREEGGEEEGRIRWGIGKTSPVFRSVLYGPSPSQPKGQSSVHCARSMTGERCDGSGAHERIQHPLGQRRLLNVCDDGDENFLRCALPIPEQFFLLFFVAIRAAFGQEKKKMGSKD